MQTRHATTAPTAVGYQNKAINTEDDGGVTWPIMTMSQIGKDKDKITLADFKVLAPDGGFYSEFGCLVSLLTAEGQCEGNYVYFDDEVASAMDAPEAGWYDFDVYDTTGEWVSVAETEVPFGDGIMVQSDSGATMVFAGQVEGENTFDIHTEDEGGVTWTGNASPVDLTLADFGVTAPDGGFYSEFGCLVSKLTAGGQAEGNYVYFDDEVAGAMDAPGAGWYDFDIYDTTGGWVSVGYVEVPSGDSLMIQSDSGASFTVPDPVAPKAE